MNMTISEIRKRIQEIKDNSHDFEAAHSIQDNLYRDVIRAIMNGSGIPKRLAKEALKAEEIDFPKYCA